MQSSEAHHLSVQVVSLDAVGLALQALPRRSALPLLAGNRAEVQEIAAARGVFCFRDVVDPRRIEAGDALSACQRPDRAGARGRPRATV